MLFVFTFMAIIALPMVNFIFPFIPQYQLRENRKLTNPPELSHWPSDLRKTIRETHRYFQDQFGLRTILVHCYNKLNKWLFDQHTQVLIGADGWLFLRHGVQAGIENPTPIIHDLCGYAGFSERDIEKWTASLVGNWKRLGAQRIAYYFVVAPNKHSIYPQHIGLSVDCTCRKTRLSTLKERLLKVPGFPWIELTEPLKKEAGSNPKNVYHLTDTHWNAYGKLTVYGTLVESLLRDLPLNSFQPLSSVISEPHHAGDLAVMLQSARHPGTKFTENGYKLQLENTTARKVATAKLGVLYSAIQKPVIWQSDQKNGVRALIFHDSFFYDEMRELLAETFEKTTFVAASFPKIAQGPIDAVQPNVVIQEMVERRLLMPIR